MHNGVFLTLREVIDFYNDGGGVGRGFDLPYQTLPSDKLNLTGKEKRQLEAFLRSLEEQ
jgi:cytochrome c peroxidase